MLRDRLTPEGKAAIITGEACLKLEEGVGRGGGSGHDKHLYRGVTILAEMVHIVGNQYSIQGW